jgi:hypothetical protein
MSSLNYAEKGYLIGTVLFGTFDAVAIALHLGGVL